MVMGPTRSRGGTRARARGGGGGGGRREAGGSAVINVVRFRAVRTRAAVGVGTTVALCLKPPMWPHHRIDQHAWYSPSGTAMWIARCGMMVAALAEATGGETEQNRWG